MIPKQQDAHFWYHLAASEEITAQNLQWVLAVQKTVITILTELNQVEDCKEAFKPQKILTVVVLYIL